MTRRILLRGRIPPSTPTTITTLSHLRVSRSPRSSPPHFFHRLSSQPTNTMAPIERITLFKIPNEADRDRVLEQYKVLAKTAVKVCINDLNLSRRAPVLTGDDRMASPTSLALPSAPPSPIPATRASTSPSRRPSRRWRTCSTTTTSVRRTRP